MNPPALGIVVALVGILVLAGLLWWRARAARGTLGLPRGRVIYADTGGWERGAPLYASRYGLSGRPDYLLRLGRQTIPVEVKPGRRAAQPYEADVLQLAAYCLLVEETTGCRPSYGLLRYKEQTFQIPYDQRVRAQLLAALAAMRRDLACRDVHRSHEEPQRCRFCGYRGHCEERM